MICSVCQSILIPIEGEIPNKVCYWCPVCERPFYENGTPVTRVGKFLGIEVWDYGGDEN